MAWEMDIFANGFSIFIHFDFERELFCCWMRMKLHFFFSVRSTVGESHVRHWTATITTYLIGKCESNRLHGVCVVLANLEYWHKSIISNWFTLHSSLCATEHNRTEHSDCRWLCPNLYIAPNHVCTRCHKSIQTFLRSIHFRLDFCFIYF